MAANRMQADEKKRIEQVFKEFQMYNFLRSNSPSNDLKWLYSAFETNTSKK